MQTSLAASSTISASHRQTEFQREVASRFGLMPNFFSSAPDAPEIIERLWAFAKAGYLDNPIPSLFKERLFVYLSRFCEVRYEAHKRVMSVAAVQQHLTASHRGEQIAVAPYLTKLCETLAQSMIGESRPVLLEVMASEGSTVVSSRRCQHRTHCHRRRDQCAQARVSAQ